MLGPKFYSPRQISTLNLESQHLGNLKANLGESYHVISILKI